MRTIHIHSSVVNVVIQRAGLDERISGMSKTDVTIQVSGLVENLRAFQRQKRVENLRAFQRQKRGGAAVGS